MRRRLHRRRSPADLLQRDLHSAPIMTRTPTAEIVSKQANTAESIALMRDPRLNSSARATLTQQIGHTHGNRYMQRMAASIQRQTDSTLRAGASGAAVRELQQLLVSTGASITVDGIFGNKTREAVIAFQQNAGLSPDGIVGPKTWGALRNGGSSNAAAGGGQVNPLIMAKIQEIKTLMQQLSSVPSHDEPVQGTMDAVATEHIGHQHDSAEGEEESWWDSATNAASDAWNSASETAGDMWNAAGDAASGAWDTVSESAGAAWNTVSDAAGSAWGTVTDTASDAWNSVKETAGEAWQGVTDAADSVSETVSEIGQAAEDFGDDLREQFADEIAAVEEIYNDIKHFIENPEDALRKLDEILNGLKKKAAELFGAEEEAEEGDVSGTVPAFTLETDPNVCHDAKDQPVRKKLRLQLQYEPTQRQETPDSGLLNHDGVHAVIDYKSDISSGDSKIVQVPSTDFGSTGSKFTIGGFDFKVYSKQDYVLVTGTFNHSISWDITDSPGRTDVKPDLDAIEDFNWKEAADDLDPDLHKTELGAPKRSKYWAKDITEAHEQFHAKDRDDYTRGAIMRYVIEQFNKREINVPWFDKEAEIKRQLKQIADEVGAEARKLLNQYIGPPEGELRAYRIDEQQYRLRAGAIRAKAIQKGWYKEDKKK